MIHFVLGIFLNAEFIDRSMMSFFVVEFSNGFLVILYRFVSVNNSVDRYGFETWIIYYTMKFEK
jgi:hypothetical protein